MITWGVGSPVVCWVGGRKEACPGGRGGGGRGGEVGNSCGVCVGGGGRGGGRQLLQQVWRKCLVGCSVTSECRLLLVVVVVVVVVVLTSEHRLLLLLFLFDALAQTGFKHSEDTLLSY